MQTAVNGGSKLLIFVLAVVPNQPWEVATWPSWRLLLPHVLVVVNRGSDEKSANYITYLLDKAGS